MEFKAQTEEFKVKGEFTLTASGNGFGQEPPTIGYDI